MSCGAWSFRGTAPRRSYTLVSMVVLSGCVVSSLAGCGCDDYASAGLTVEIVDGAERNVCVDTVSISDGDFSEDLESVPTDGGCLYIGAWERAGDYTIEGSDDKGTAFVDGVKVGEDRCHVKPVSISVPLEA